MESLNMFSQIWNVSKSVFNRVKEAIKTFIKPATVSLVTSAAADMTKSKKDLVAENAILRQQLIVLKRQVKRPKFNDGDRFRLVFLSTLTNYWDKARIV
jgi:hypothetical protein